MVHRIVASSNRSPPVAVGDILLSHAVSCIPTPIFDRAVILIDEVVDEEMTAGQLGAVRGIVLNHPTGTTLRQLLLGWPLFPDRAWAERLGPLLDLELLCGGPVMGGSLQDGLSWLHLHGARVPGAREIAPSLWSGGDLGELAALDLEGLDGLWPVIGFAGWAPPQLDNELERGVWVHARPETPMLARLCLGSNRESAAAWRAAMRAAGLPGLADVPRGRAVDKRLVALLGAHRDCLEEGVQSGTSSASSSPRPEEGAQSGASSASSSPRPEGTPTSSSARRSSSSSRRGGRRG